MPRLRTRGQRHTGLHHRAAPLPLAVDIDRVTTPAMDEVPSSADPAKAGVKRTRGTSADVDLGASAAAPPVLRAKKPAVTAAEMEALLSPGNPLEIYEVLERIDGGCFGRVLRARER